MWGVNPWGVQAIDKNPQGILVLGDDGDVVESGEPGQATTGTDDRPASEPDIREPDDNGIDDPPVAVDDPVTARSGASVPVQVTVNDYDPDGEAIAVSAVGTPGHGSVDIGTATTVVYTPEPGYVGIDEFEYTIVDGNGTTATASVIIDLLAPGSTNKAPVGVADTAETGPGVPVVIDVLLNDVDPERDALRLGGFSPPQSVGQATLGEVTESLGPSGLPALRFAPTEGFEGTAIFTYRPIDALEAVGEDVEVRIEVARVGDPNRPPLVRPDAVRLRRDVTTQVPVLVNDSDPDGDQLTLSVIEPLPDGLDVAVEGEELAVTARAGAASLVPFTYSVDDGNGHVVRGSVLVGVIDDIEPNRPPVVTADTDKVVVGQAVVVDVTANDVDPDGDPLTVTSVSQPADSGGQAIVFSREKIQFSPAPHRRRRGPGDRSLHLHRQRRQRPRGRRRGDDHGPSRAAGRAAVCPRRFDVHLRRRAGDRRRVAQRRRPVRRPSDTRRSAGVPVGRQRHHHRERAGALRPAGRAVRSIPVHVRGDERRAGSRHRRRSSCRSASRRSRTWRPKPTSTR